jgi:hypothetical protein
VAHVLIRKVSSKCLSYCWVNDLFSFLLLLIKTFWSLDRNGHLLKRKMFFFVKKNKNEAFVHRTWTPVFLVFIGFTDNYRSTTNANLTQNIDYNGFIFFFKWCFESNIIIINHSFFAGSKRLAKLFMFRKSTGNSRISSIHGFLSSRSSTLLNALQSYPWPHCTTVHTKQRHYTCSQTCTSSSWRLRHQTR